MTENPVIRAARALGAAEVSLQAGAFDEARRLVAVAEAEVLDEFQRARVDLLRGHLAFAAGLGSDAGPLLVKAARSLEAYDIGLARETYLIAWFATVSLGHHEGGDVMLDICRAVEALPRPSGAPRPRHLLLDALVLLTTGGHGVATPLLQRAAAELTNIPAEDVRRWGWAAPAASSSAWDDAGLLAISARNMQIVRDAGAYAELPQHVLSFGIARMWIGDFGRSGRGAGTVARGDGRVVVGVAGRSSPETVR